MSLYLTEANISLNFKFDGGYLEIQNDHHKNACIKLLSNQVMYVKAFVRF